ncbi:HEAT repeat domain-containing protein [Candidatus Nitronereus thalassa]|uniref:HEAT repeat domain-containing protein n=1 Tax=Candidatus Nitronereus thalassa TaxID=3020898 RepID=A0ABU3KC15_9BACT|nr:HEAT repeat domain-containing protein [Candidatus Nitronereus thalassa]MDT7043971.1 HEAT repeat domain-containing protein [Candidatus Nitronereus thalassa]
MMTHSIRLFLSICLVILGIAAESSARRTHIDQEQRTQLAKIKTVYLNIIALTENGRVPSDDLSSLIKSRMEEIGYTVVTDKKAPHDVQFFVKCEERKRWKGTTPSGGDAELADAPARLWRGPACLFNYLLDGRDLGWYKETRTDFEDAYAAAQQAKVKDSGEYAMSQLKLKLEKFDFPVMAATEWGHTERLAKLLEDPKTSKPRLLRILGTLSKVQSKAAMPHLIKLAHDENTEYAEEAIIALAGMGSSATPILTDIFVNSKISRIQAAAAKGLGLIGAHTGDPTITPPLLDYLNKNLEDMDESSDIDFPVLTEVVWSIAKLRNDKSIVPIEQLNIKIWLIRDTSEEMKKLREAANVATKMVDLDYQIM